MQPIELLLAAVNFNLNLNIDCESRFTLPIFILKFDYSRWDFFCQETGDLFLLQIKNYK